MMFSESAESSCKFGSHLRLAAARVFNNILGFIRGVTLLADARSGVFWRRAQAVSLRKVDALLKCVPLCVRQRKPN